MNRYTIHTFSLLTLRLLASQNSENVTVAYSVHCGAANDRA